MTSRRWYLITVDFKSRQIYYFTAVTNLADGLCDFDKQDTLDRFVLFQKNQPSLRSRYRRRDNLFDGKVPLLVVRSGC